jgi:kynurenine formamidase
MCRLFREGTCNRGDVRVRRLVDLSAPVDEATVVFPGDPAPRLEVHSTIERDGFNLLRLQLGSQTGTHVDAPYHFEETGARLHELPLERFVGRGVLVEARGLPPRTPVTWDLFEPIADRLGEDCVVLLHTGWSRFYGSPAYFEHPFLDAHACRRLLELGVRTICIDAVNIDETPDEAHPGAGYPAHHLIAAAGGVIGENFRNLDQLSWADPMVMLFPIALQGSDGAPVRAVAVDFEG